MTILNITILDNLISSMSTSISSSQVLVDNKLIGQLKDKRAKFKVDSQKFDLIIKNQLLTSNRITIEHSTSSDTVDIEVQVSLFNWEFALVGLLIMILSFISDAMFEELGFLIMNLIPFSLALIYFFTRARKIIIRISQK